MAVAREIPYPRDRPLRLTVMNASQSRRLWEAIHEDRWIIQQAESLGYDARGMFWIFETWQAKVFQSAVWSLVRAAVDWVELERKLARVADEAENAVDEAAVGTDWRGVRFRGRHI